MMFRKICCIIVISLISMLQIRAQEKLFIDGTVEFVVNTDVPVKNENYYHFINETLPYLRNNVDDIESVILIGSASPEGNYNHNVHLANIRAEKLYSYMESFLPRAKIVIDNDYSLFLKKTGLDESDYQKLRATYIEVKLSKDKKEPKVSDTIVVEYKNIWNTELVFQPIFVNEKKDDCVPVFSVYNDLLSDLLFRANIRAEVYFNKMSFFVEVSFSAWKFIGKTYNIDVWHIGFRKYFNNDYNKLFIEINANAGYFDTDLFGSCKFGVLYGGGVGCGYVFSLKHHWKIYPIIRFGLFERVYYSDYNSDGNINVSFGNYTNWKTNGTGDTTTNNGVNGVPVNKVINNDFFEKSNKAYYIGPTYVGIVLKKDFCVNKKNKKKKD